MTHLLVTNDFPPKVGGIQSYLWELWRRLDPKSFAVITTAHPGSPAFDAEQAFRIDRVPAPVLLPSPSLTKRVRAKAEEVGASLVVLDPALPLGLIGPGLGIPYAVVMHGAELSLPAHLPVARQALLHVLRNASWLLATGGYPAGQAARALGAREVPISVIPPGVDTSRFVPLEEADRAAARALWRLPGEGPLVVSVSRLVPRKGMDTLIDASAQLCEGFPDLSVAIAGAGRDRGRLAVRIVRSDAPVRLLGEVANAELPLLYGCGDVFAMLCRSRWGGLEQEGFGIVFLEAAAAGVPQVAGDSGGASDAVENEVTGFVVSESRSSEAAARALAKLLGGEGLRRQMGEAARKRAVASFDYDVLASRLNAAISEVSP